MSKWHKGPPPSIGWWPASWCRDEVAIRWWDGKSWSHPAGKSDTKEEAGIEALHKSPNQECIEWTNRPDSWPEWSKT